jgi:hypothetical protein
MIFKGVKKMPQEEEKIIMVGISWCDACIEQLEHIDYTKVDVCMKDKAVAVDKKIIPICDFGAKIPDIHTFPHWINNEGQMIGSGRKSQIEQYNMNANSKRILKK